MVNLTLGRFFPKNNSASCRHPSIIVRGGQPFYKCLGILSHHALLKEICWKTFVVNGRVRFWFIMSFIYLFDDFYSKLCILQWDLLRRFVFDVVISTHAHAQTHRPVIC